MGLLPYPTQATFSGARRAPRQDVTLLTQPLVLLLQRLDAVTRLPQVTSQKLYLSKVTHPSPLLASSITGWQRNSTASSYVWPATGVSLLMISQALSTHAFHCATPSSYPS